MWRQLRHRLEAEHSARDRSAQIAFLVDARGSNAVDLSDGDADQRDAKWAPCISGLAFPSLASPARARLRPVQSSSPPLPTARSGQPSFAGSVRPAPSRASHKNSVKARDVSSPSYFTGLPLLPIGAR
jgi:hypothetical protein